jgi:hypothetical protein
MEWSPTVRPGMMMLRAPIWQNRPMRVWVNSIVAGNPAKIIRENIETVHWGRLKQYDDA